MNILANIKNPQDIKKLNNEDLKILCNQLRDKIINTCAANGGHLAPSLGTVELSVALHKVYNSPNDKIIWDVGHQAYAHKLLTGRYENFHTLRQKNGITGFPKQKESIHDAFGVGHASTSISAALGMAVARDIKNEKSEVVAIIGDGALTGGEAFEGLNNAGISKRKILVILNDNQMSINHNVGAISEYLSIIRVDEKFNRAKEDASKIIKNIPKIGKTLWHSLSKVKQGVVSTLTPGAFFEALGFNYIGPIDGNDLFPLINILEKIKDNTDEPILLHIHTKKGLGYHPAENKPSKYHGIGKFNIETGSANPSNSNIKTYTEVFSETLVDLAKKDNKIVGITAAMPSGTGIDKLQKAFPERTFDVGIAEEHAVTFAAGIASNGLKPVVAIYSTFMQRGFDQLIHDVALQKLPIVFALDRAGLVGEDGPTHHGVFDIAYMRMIPNMVVMAPKDERELKNMLFSAMEYNLPTSIRYPRGMGEGVLLEEEYDFINLGKGEVINEDDGADLLLLPIGSMVHETIKASLLLKEKGVKSIIINPRFIKPLDEDLILKYIAKVKNIVTIEEGVKKGGFYGEISELLYRHKYRDISLYGIGIEDEFIEQGTHKELLDLCGLTKEKITDFITFNIYNGKKNE